MGLDNRSSFFACAWLCWSASKLALKTWCWWWCCSQEPRISQYQVQNIIVALLRNSQPPFFIFEDKSCHLPFPFLIVGIEFSFPFPTQIFEQAWLFSIPIPKYWRLSFHFRSKSQWFEIGSAISHSYSQMWKSQSYLLFSSLMKVAFFYHSRFLGLGFIAAVRGLSSISCSMQL